MEQSTVDVFTQVIDTDRPLEVEPRQAIVEKPSAIVPLGTGPDGLSILLRVTRRAQVRGPVLEELGLTIDDPVPPELEQALASLEHSAARYARSRGVEVIESALCYRSQWPLNMLMERTLMSQALGLESPIVFDELIGLEKLVLTNMVVDQLLEKRQLLEESETESYLALPIEGEGALVTRVRDEGVVRTRQLLFETLSSFASPAYHVRDNIGIEETLPFDAGRYVDSLLLAYDLGWSVSDEDLIRAISQLSRRVHIMHIEGVVHGDLKPPNVLIADEGAIPIDSLDVKLGEPSFAATPGWAAPEQILARPVSPATDIYALGLMVAKILGAAIHGEERSFIVPCGGSSRRRVRLLSDPRVFVDLYHSGIGDAFLRPWETLIRSCLTFDNEHRLNSASELADRIDQLLRDDPPKKRCWLRAGPGSLCRKLDDHGQGQPCWVINDGAH